MQILTVEHVRTFVHTHAQRTHACACHLHDTMHVRSRTTNQLTLAGENLQAKAEGADVIRRLAAALRTKTPSEGSDKHANKEHLQKTKDKKRKERKKERKKQQQTRTSNSFQIYNKKRLKRKLNTHTRATRHGMQKGCKLCCTYIHLKKGVYLSSFEIFENFPNGQRAHCDRHLQRGALFARAVHICFLYMH